jgi:DNA-directed RNA polymerase subunit RPC12/RpoP
MSNRAEECPGLTLRTSQSHPHPVRRVNDCSRHSVTEPHFTAQPRAAASPPFANLTPNNYCGSLQIQRRAAGAVFRFRRLVWYPLFICFRARATFRWSQSASSIKPPTRCPHCDSTRLIKKGTRAKKLERVPLYRCRACGRTFAAGPLAIRNKTYPLPEILEALTLYNRGNTLEGTATKISSRYGHPVAASTISRWLSEHPTLTSYRRLRARGRRLFSPTRIIRAQKLYHRQVYEFAYHRAKLSFLKDGTLDDKRAAGTASTSRFSGLANFLESVPTTCPHDLFRKDDSSRKPDTMYFFVFCKCSTELALEEMPENSEPPFRYGSGAVTCPKCGNATRYSRARVGRTRQ